MKPGPAPRPSALRLALPYGGAFVLGLCFMHTVAGFFGARDEGPAQAVAKQDQPTSVVAKPVVQPQGDKDDHPTDRPSKPRAGTSYCDLIETVNTLGKSVQYSKLSVGDLLHVLSQSIKPFQFIQIGAHVGGVNASHDDTMPLTKRYGWHGLLVEPNPFLFKELVRKYRDWPNLYFAPVGIGAVDGNMTFYAVTDEIDPETGKSLTGGRDRQWYVTQLSTFDEAIAKKRMRSVKMVPMPVEVNTFPTLVAKDSHTIKAPHYVLIDTEGYDWKVLSTIDLQKFRPFLLIYEHNKLGPHRKTASDYTAKAGYRSTLQDHQNTVAWRACSPEEAAALPPNDLAATLVA
eukprot:EG_transcript_18612